MGNNSLLSKLPEGYIKQRKRSVQILFCLIYVVCLFLLIIKYQILIISGTTGSLLGLLLFFTNFAVMLYVNVSKRIYKKTEVPNYNEIHIFTIKELIFYFLPILFFAYFTLLQIAFYFCFLGSIYHGIDKIIRPNDSMTLRK